MAPTIAVIAAGAMGAGVAKRLAAFGVTVKTNLDNRSEASRRRAQDAGMQDIPFHQLGSCDFMLSILPPSDAFALAEKYIKECGSATSPIYVDCNAVSPETALKIGGLFKGTSIKFVDAGIIGGPPKGEYNPTFYASGDDHDALRSFEGLAEVGLKISALRDEGAGIGSASALKMSYAGITKGTTALFTTMILAAYQSSPATADALLNELHASQPAFLKRITNVIPPMVPKAQRWVFEMQEIASFVSGEEGQTYNGVAKLYERIARSEKGDGRDIENLAQFSPLLPRIPSTRLRRVAHTQHRQPHPLRTAAETHLLVCARRIPPYQGAHSGANVAEELYAIIDLKIPFEHDQNRPLSSRHQPCRQSFSPRVYRCAQWRSIAQTVRL
uniref:NAD-binding phosphogluconate dehydrogenase-like protein n=1 Tax=Mycena chlorophos TaxID=658473 RepID=A0ABQ0M2Y9_MYCCL|nr:NAD-binding phosphogluconate dehydrogenase-like protein [Mycena chlorophos]